MFHGALLVVGLLNPTQIYRAADDLVSLIGLPCPSHPVLRMECVLALLEAARPAIDGTLESTIVSTVTNLEAETTANGHDVPQKLMDRILWEQQRGFGARAVWSED